MDPRSHNNDETSRSSNNNTRPDELQEHAAVAPVSSVDARRGPEIKYSVESFYAIVQPVLLTMIFAALSVVYIRTPESAEANEEALTNSYTVLDTDEDSSNAKQLGQSLVNGLVIVSAICALTFVIVLLYKYRCMKLLIGYMILSSALLLGFLAAQMFEVAIEKYELQIDKISFWLIMYNFAITGVVAIFAPAGVVPVYIGQAYLIATSVIVAWQLSFFEPFLAWVLLVLLALYDLFAVLTPCGPLKALVKLMQRDDAPNMPGLLYEASLPGHNNNNAGGGGRSQQQRNNGGRSRNSNSNHSTTATNNNHTATINMSTTRRPPEPGDTASETEDDEEVPSRRGSTATGATTTTMASADDATTVIHDEDRQQSAAAVTTTPTTLLAASVHDHSSAPSDVEDGEAPIAPPQAAAAPAEEEQVEMVTAPIPLALAKMYKLRFLHDPQPYWITGEEPVTFTAEQLTQDVDVLFAENGGRIVPTASLGNAAHEVYRRPNDPDSPETRYTVIHRSGEHRRVLFVNAEGRVFEDLRAQNAEEERKERTSIKLGLGDFIFYSVLVSKAALYSFTTFAVCSLAILSGLGLTLLLLAMYGKALPALPISIMLGVVFYLTTRYVTEPWIQTVWIEQVYV